MNIKTKIKNMFVKKDLVNDEISLKRKRGGAKKLTPETVQLIRKTPGTYRSIARLFDVHWNTICQVKNKITWKHIL